MNNYILTCVDTDSVTFCKPDQSPFTENEYLTILVELNSLLPKKVQLTFEDQFKKIIVLKAKNYIYKTSKDEIILKGSALKSSTLEPILKQFIGEIIDSLLEDRNNFIDIYHRYVKMSQNIEDIRPWASKRTLSATTYESTRENEAKIIRAIQGTDYVEGDKVYLFYDENDELILVENFKGSYNKTRMLEKLFKIMQRFSTILDMSQFLNYKLKRNSEKLNELLNL